MRSQQYQLIWIASAFSILIVSPSWASEAVETQYQDSTSSQEVLALNEFEQPATTLDEWRDQIAQTTIVPITGIRLSATDAGVEVILETADGQLSEPSTSVVDNTLIVEIPNAVLALPEGDEFQQTSPAEGIALVSVTRLPNNRVRVAITGANAPPTTEVRMEAQRLLLSVAPGTETDVAQDEDAIQVVVTGAQNSYFPSDATTATRTDTPLRDIPQSIQVVPRQVLEDQAVTNLQEATRNVSGVVEGNTFANTQDRFIIRGFQQGFQLGSTLRDGFRFNSNFNGVRDPANIDRIEILKGPASAIFGGAIEPGGLINIITEQPLEEPFYLAELQVGSFGFVRPTIDLSGPLNTDRTLLYRLNLAYERGDGFRDFDQEIERVFVAPVILWRIGDRTDLILELEYLNDERPFDRGLLAIGDDIVNIPFDRILGEPDDIARNEEFSIGYRLEHRLSEDWTIRNAFRFTDAYQPNRRAEPNSFDEGTGILTRTWEDQEYFVNGYTLQTNVIGEFSTGSIGHTLLFGVDLERQAYDSEAFSTDALSINIFDPNYGTAARPQQDEFPTEAGIFNEQIDLLGIYLQDQVTLLDNLKLLVGGRFDIVDQRTKLGGSFGESESQQQDEAFTPRIGIVYQPIEPLSLYASFSQSFAPNSGRTVDGSILEPVRGTQYEIGMRGEWFDGRLITNLAAYHLTRSNVAATDPDNPDFSIAIGEQRSQGVEFDVIGEILPGWNVIASYAHTDAEITRDNSPREGNQLFGVPENAASLWSTYEIQSGDLQGLGFGLGLFFVGERQGDVDNSFQVPSYVRTDASLFYRRNNWRAAINVKNLFDVNYIESAAFRTAINPGSPFTILGTISVEF
ncbi:TonB-dependent siderophore receptor [Gloeocapsa sp. PCC 7428]|uniref:TonB-dependent receptor n=1 Tax=Gloeocapsa sp. PCC 7428 TaxID=1173026 RepID=UPI0002A61E09|nr:TonB-dependent receptor [Gloeocapsa sp. PCC 7428]AFZ33131.1 TonB-dependent siderophore receptor [Gloeocapsa sp. PCC 7428]